MNAPPAVAKRAAIAADRDKAEAGSYVRRGKDDAVKLRGWLSVTPSEGDGHDHENRYTVHTKDGSFPVEFDGKLVESGKKVSPLPNQVVAVTGKQVGDVINVASGDVERTLLAGGLDPSAGPRAPYQRKVLAIRVQATGLGTPWSTAGINTAVADGSAYWSRQSNGRVTLATPVHQTVTISATAPDELLSDSCPNDNKLKERADAQLPASVNRAQYDHVMYVYQVPASASSDCRRAHAEYDSENSWYPIPEVGGTIAHEFGHNFGLGHSAMGVCTSGAAVAPNSRVCGPQGLPPYSADSVTAYGDRTDVMGGNVTGSLSGVHRAATGVMPLSSVKTVKPSSTTHRVGKLTVDPAAGGTQLLEIATPVDEQSRYYVDARRFGLPDDSVATYGASPSSRIFQGVYVRRRAPMAVASDTVALHANAAGAMTGNPLRANLRDEALNSGRFTDANGLVIGGIDVPLGAGQSIWDPEGDFSISVAASDANGADVNVTAGGPPGNPTVVSAANGVLSVVAGAGKRNNVILARAGTSLYVTDSSATVQVSGSACVALDRITARCVPTGIQSAVVELGDGDDSGAVAAKTQPAGNGEWLLPVTFRGGAGDDLLEGGPGDDVLDGGLGNDLTEGRGGVDTLTYADRSTPITIDGSGYADGAKTTGERDINRLDGGDLPEILLTGSGNDVIKATTTATAPATRTIEPGTGVDTVTGSSGRDVIRVNDGVVDGTITCGAGTDDVVYDTSEAARLSSTCETAGRRTAPEARITEAPPTVTANNQPRVRFTASAPASTMVTFSCKVTGTTSVTKSPCISGEPLPPLSPGTKTLAIQAFVGGVASGPPATGAFTVDTTAPETSVEIIGTSYVGNSVDVSPSSDDPQALFECRIAPEPWLPCSTGTAVPFTTTGQLTLEARAVDLAGNIDASPATKPVNADDPWFFRPRFVSGPADGATITSSSVAYGFAAVPAEFRLDCRWQLEGEDAGNWAECTNGVVRRLPAGTHRIAVRAQTLDGSTTTTNVLRKVTVVPKVNITPQGIALYGGINLVDDVNAKVAFASTGLGPYRYECQRKASEAYAPCTSPLAVGTWEIGSYRLNVRAINTTTGIEEGTRGTYSLLVGFPDTNIDSPRDLAVVRDTKFDFSRTWYIGDDTYECSLNSGTTPVFTPCADGMSSPTATQAAGTTNVLLVRSVATYEATVNGQTVQRRLVDETPAKVTYVQGEGDLSIAEKPAPPASIALSGPIDSQPVRDWVYWWGPASTDRFERATDAADQLIGNLITPTWGNLGGTAQPATSTNTFSWTNAAVSPAAGSRTTGVDKYGANGAGFRVPITAPAGQTQTIHVWVTLKGASVRGVLRADWSKLGGLVGTTSRTQTVPIAGPASGTAVRHFVLKAKPGPNVDSVTLRLTKSEGPTDSASAVGLRAVAVTQ